MKLTLTLCFLLVSFSFLQAQQNHTVTISSGGLQRSVLLHLPSATPAANLPLLLVFHGSDGTSAGIESTTGFDALADQYNFIVAYPQSVAIAGDVQWNVYVDDKPGDLADGVNDPNAPDDVQFTRDIISSLGMSYLIDAKRVYATGLSNGAYMCYALSLLAPNDIQAIAPVAGSIWGEQNYLNSIAADVNIRTMPVMHIHGTADNVVDYPDPDNTPSDYQEWPLWMSARGCAGKTYSSVIPLSPSADKLVFCPPPEDVSLIRIKGMGHAWTDGKYQTSKEIVKFFKLGTPSGIVADNRQEKTAVWPNPAGSQVHVQLKAPSTVQLFSSQGRNVYSERHLEGDLVIDTRNFASGIYELRIGTPGESKSTKITVVH